MDDITSRDNGDPSITPETTAPRIIPITATAATAPATATMATGSAPPAGSLAGAPGGPITARLDIRPEASGPPCVLCGSPLRCSLVRVRGPLVVAYTCDTHGLMSYGLPSSR